MIPHTWYKIVSSSSEDVENMAHATGQSWSLFQKLLLHLNYLTTYKDSFRINIENFDNLKDHENINGNMHIDSAQPHKNKKVYYIRLNTPIFKNSTL